MGLGWVISYNWDSAEEKQSLFWLQWGVGATSNHDMKYNPSVGQCDFPTFGLRSYLESFESGIVTESRQLEPWLVFVAFFFWSPSSARRARL